MRQGSIDIVHGAATKEWLREQIQTFGPGPVLGHHTISIDAAVRRLDADPRQFFVLHECDNQRADGSCGGHPVSRPSLYRWRCSCDRRGTIAVPWPAAAFNARAHARRCGGVPVLEEIRKPRPRIERPNPEAWVYG